MPKQVRFTDQAVRKHLLRHHPACPPLVREKILYRVIDRTWDCSIGCAVGLSIQNFVRHELTDYEQLYRVPGLTKEEARLIIKDEVKDIIARWAVPRP